MTDLERRLAAILSADVAGYSRLMAEDEVATVQTLTAYREEMAVLIRQHRGRVVDTPGDNLLAEFPSALEATHCAVELQRVLAARNADRPPERKMEFRIGVHLGDVMVEGERIYGDGVNIAARLEGLAEAGGICISATVHEQVRSKLPLAFADLGEQRVKNIPQAVRVYRVRLEPRAAEAGARGSPGSLRWVVAAVALLLGLASWLFWSRGPEHAPAPEAAAPTPAAVAGDADSPGAKQLSVANFSGHPAIAVLAFDNLSGNPDQEYFADGIAEDLITRLSARRRLRVIARNSSFTYKGRPVDVKQVGRELGARYVVEGSVRRADDRIRISAQLIDATTGHHLWAETFDRELRDVFAVQDEISQAIGAAIDPELLRAEMDRARSRESTNLEAYDLFMRGLWHAFRYNERDNVTARSLFEKAAELDPHFAPAFSQLAFAHFQDISYGWSGSIPRSLEELEQAARRSVELDPRDPWSQQAMAVAYGLTGRGDQAIAASERAVRLNPSLADGYATLGTFLALTGRPEEAVENLEQAMRLSPHDPDRPSHHLGMGWAHFAAGRYDEAAESARRSLRGAPSYNLAHRLLAASYAQLGRFDEAHAALEDNLRVEPGFSIRKLEVQISSMDPDFRDRYVEGLRKAGLPEE